MMNKFYTSLAIMMLTLVSCNKVPEQVTQQSDYEKYLEEDSEITVEKIKQDHDFWKKKIGETPGQFPYLVKMAAAESGLFNLTGDIEYLIMAENNLKEAIEKTNYNNAGYLKSLARNYISQHRFREALTLLDTAEVIGEKINGTHKMLFDVHMELGNYDKAETYLQKIEDPSDFDFLIRYAKWSDHKGDLGTAITNLEKARGKAELANIKDLKQWSYTNLADFYGHNGEIQKSYKHYLMALELDPNDAYAKKGIAWIIYSHERNPKEALRILNSITKQHQAPDYYLLKAEIAEFMNDDASKKLNQDLFLTAVSNENFGGMYNFTIAILYAEELLATEKAFDLAIREIKNRSTPQAYDLLAWAHYNNGDYEKALEIAEQHVVNKTFEPNVLLHLAHIYKATGKTKEAESLKKELMESIYELGPVAEQKIRQI
ncbi:MAG: cell surface protein [Gillisia sp.]